MTILRGLMVRNILEYNGYDRISFPQMISKGNKKVANGVNHQRLFEKLIDERYF
jgi:hypothetical protein